MYVSTYQNDIQSDTHSPPPPYFPFPFPLLQSEIIINFFFFFLPPPPLQKVHVGEEKKKNANPLLVIGIISFQ